MNESFAQISFPLHIMSKHASEPWRLEGRTKVVHDKRTSVKLLQFYANPLSQSLHALILLIPSSSFVINTTFPRVRLLCIDLLEASCQVATLIDILKVIDIDALTASRYGAAHLWVRAWKTRALVWVVFATGMQGLLLIRTILLIVEPVGRVWCVRVLFTGGPQCRLLLLLLSVCGFV